MNLADVCVGRKEVTALACVDGSAGLLLDLYAPAHDDDAEAISQRLLEVLHPRALAAEEACTIAHDGVHAIVRVPKRPDLLLVVLARPDANVSSLRAWLRDVAGRVAQSA